MNTTNLSRTTIDIEHHTTLRDFYFELFNRLSPRCAKRRARAQHRFNFHQGRLMDLYKIQKTEPLQRTGEAPISY